MIDLFKKYSAFPGKVTVSLLKRLPGCKVLQEEYALLITKDFLDKSQDKIFIPQYDKLDKLSTIGGYIAVGAKLIVTMTIALRIGPILRENISSFYSFFISDNYWLILLLRVISIILLGLLILPLIDAIAIFIHEWMHVIGHLGNDATYNFVYDNVTGGISGFSLKWDSKKVALLSVILPLMSFLIVAVIVYIFSGHMLFTLYIAFSGFQYASSDIGVFFVILHFVPRGTFSFGRYYIERR